MWYSVIVDGENKGGIWQELKEIYPDDWTIGVKDELCNWVTSLEKCKERVLEIYPNATLKEMKDEEEDIKIIDSFGFIE